MPRYYCDYCDTYLTHDSQAGRKQHNRGWKHRENVKLYYEQFLANAGQIGLMTPGAWLRGPPIGGALPPRPGMFPPPRGMMPPPGPGGVPPMMRPPFQGMPPPRGPPPMAGAGFAPPPRPSIYGPQ